MSNRFHNKWHRYNHHTDATPGVPDSGKDPIASPDDPFKGDFYIDGAVSARAVTAENVFATNLIAVSSEIQILDINVDEISGFRVVGTDVRTEPPVTFDPYSEQGFVLSGVGLSSSSWAIFDGSVRVSNNLYVNNDLNVTGTINGPNINIGNWNSAYTTVCSNSAVWNSAYSIVCANSANWDSTFTTVAGNSGDWNSVYTTVCANSGNWDSTYSSVCANSAAWLEPAYFNHFPKIGKELDDGFVDFVFSSDYTRKSGDTNFLIRDNRDQLVMFYKAQYTKLNTGWYRGIIQEGELYGAGNRQRMRVDPNEIVFEDRWFATAGGPFAADDGFKDIVNAGSNFVVVETLLGEVYFIDTKGFSNYIYWEPLNAIRLYNTPADAPGAARYAPVDIGNSWRFIYLSGIDYQVNGPLSAISWYNDKISLVAGSQTLSGFYTNTDTGTYTNTRNVMTILSADYPDGVSYVSAHHIYPDGALSGQVIWNSIDDVAWESTIPDVVPISGWRYGNSFSPVISAPPYWINNNVPVSSVKWDFNSPYVPFGLRLRFGGGGGFAGGIFYYDIRCGILDMYNGAFGSAGYCYASIEDPAVQTNGLSAGTGNWWDQGGGLSRGVRTSYNLPLDILTNGSTITDTISNRFTGPYAYNLWTKGVGVESPAAADGPVFWQSLSAGIYPYIQEGCGQINPVTSSLTDKLVSLSRNRYKAPGQPEIYGAGAASRATGSNLPSHLSFASYKALSGGLNNTIDDMMFCSGSYVEKTFRTLGTPGWNRDEQNLGVRSPGANLSDTQLNRVTDGNIILVDDAPYGKALGSTVLLLENYIFGIGAGVNSKENIGKYFFSAKIKEGDEDLDYKYNAYSGVDGLCAMSNVTAYKIETDTLTSFRIDNRCWGTAFTTNNTWETLSNTNLRVPYQGAQGFWDATRTSTSLVSTPASALDPTHLLTPYPGGEISAFGLAINPTTQAGYITAKGLGLEFPVLSAYPSVAHYRQSHLNASSIWDGKPVTTKMLPWGMDLNDPDNLVVYQLAVNESISGQHTTLPEQWVHYGVPQLLVGLSSTTGIQWTTAGNTDQGGYLLSGWYKNGGAGLNGVSNRRSLDFPYWSTITTPNSGFIFKVPGRQQFDGSSYEQDSHSIYDRKTDVTSHYRAAAGQFPADNKANQAQRFYKLTNYLPKSVCSFNHFMSFNPLFGFYINGDISYSGSGDNTRDSTQAVWGSSKTRGSHTFAFSGGEEFFKELYYDPGTYSATEGWTTAGKAVGSAVNVGLFESAKNVGSLAVIAVASSNVFIGGYYAPILADETINLAPAINIATPTTNYIYLRLASKNDWDLNNDGKPYSELFTSTDLLPSIFSRVLVGTAVAVTDGFVDSIDSLTPTVLDHTRLYNLDVVDDLHTHNDVGPVTFTTRLSSPAQIPTPVEDSYIIVKVGDSEKAIRLYTET